MEALNVPKDAYFFLTDNGVGFNYTLTEKNLMPFYEYLARNTSIRVLVYNGDTDPSVNSFASQNWTNALDLKETQVYYVRYRYIYIYVCCVKTTWCIYIYIY